MKKLLLTTSALALASFGAQAANQGLTGPTSTGDLEVSMDIVEEVKVSNLADIALGQYVPGGGNLVGNSPACVHYNNATTYTIQFDSTNGAGAGFTLDDGAANTVPYTVEYDDTQGGGFISISDGVSANVDGADTANNDDCATLGSDNGDIRATVTDVGLLGVPNGTYTDTLVVTVSPNP